MQFIEVWLTFKKEKLAFQVGLTNSQTLSSSASPKKSLKNHSICHDLAIEVLVLRTIILIHHHHRVSHSFFSTLLFPTPGRWVSEVDAI